MMATVTPIATPLTLYKQWIEAQGFTEQDVRNMGLRLISPAEAVPIMKYNIEVHSVLIPYPASEYCRVRRLGVTENKYMGPKDSGHSPIYLSPGLGIQWDDIKADVESPIIITEGEAKSYTGCKHGGVVIGIGGVQMQAPLFDGSWEWKGRTVSVCFDHDAGQSPGGYKPGVANALGKLCTSLIEVGAIVNVLHLGFVNPNPDGKCGLDDYLIAGGTWPDLLRTASPPPEWCSQLADMIDSCAYVVGTNHTHVYNLLNRSRKSPSDFHDAHIEKKRMVVGENGKAISKPISRIWIEHPGRVTVENYDLNPRLPFGVQGSVINLWEGYPSFKMGARAKTEAVQAEWQKFMEGLFGEHWEWVGLWAGHMLNRPWERTTQAVMLLTMVQGIGKSLFGDVLRDLTGKHGLEGKSSRMFGGFNSEMEAKTFIMVNELDVKFNAREGQLNDLLTEEVVTIEQKGKDVIELPNLRRWYFTTNTSSPCRLSRGQRRVLVVTPPRVMADTRGEWGGWVRETVAKFRRDGEALAAIRGWFDTLWYEKGEGSWDSTAPVEETEAARDAADASMTTNQIIADHLYEWICAQPDGWAAVHPNVRKGGTKAFGDLGSLVKAHGGFVGQKTVKEDGVVKTYTIYDTCGRVERLVKPSSGNANMVVESGDAKDRALKLAYEYVKLQEILVGRG